MHADPSSAYSDEALAAVVAKVSADAPLQLQAVQFALREGGVLTRTALAAVVPTMCLQVRRERSSLAHLEDLPIYKMSGYLPKTHLLTFQTIQFLVT